MVHVARIARRWLDSVSVRRFARLTRAAALALAVFFCALGFVQPAHASSNPSYDAAMANCQSYALAAHYPGATISGEACVTGTFNGNGYVCKVGKVNTTSQTNCPIQDWIDWEFTGSVPPSNPCTSIGSFPMVMDGKLLDGTSFTENATDSNGNTVACAMTFTPTGRPIWNPYSNTWQTAGVAAATGNPSSMSATGNPTGNWADSTGAALNPQPTADPSAGGAAGSAPPPVCGGGSCYDPSTDQFCSTAGGQQYCVPGTSATGSPGSCTYGATSAICGGSPTPPLPAVNPITAVTDPATQITSSDTYTTANPATGAVTTTTINNYAAPGTTTSSGQTASASGPAGGGQAQGGNPAHASSAGGNGTLSGGGNCTTPPVCTGDAVLCGVARTQWSTTCQVHTDLAGDGTGVGKLQTDSAANPPASAWVPTSSSGNATADNANAGIYDTSGFGYATQCPMQDLTVQVGDGQFIIPFSKGCVIGPWIAGVIKAFALYTALLITLGKSN